MPKDPMDIKRLGYTSKPAIIPFPSGPRKREVMIAVPNPSAITIPLLIKTEKRSFINERANG